MENFSEWFHDILENADITDSRYPIKGMAVWRPYGFQIRRATLNIFRDLMDKEHDETLFPLLIPEAELAKEGIHVKGFEDEVYWVTHGGQTELNEKLAIRPTSETAMYPMFALWVRSHIAEQVETGIELYKKFFDGLGIAYLISKRPVWDKFPGAEYTMAFDTIMPDGKTLQIGTVHNLGQTFAHTFEITFENKEGNHEYAYQTCYGISDRVIAAAIAAHGDEKGLQLPPEISPKQITIIPIIFKDGGEEVMAKCNEIKDALEAKGIRVQMDTRDIRPGKKFFDWELKGTPLRFELGPRDLNNNVAIIGRRDTGEKIEVSLDDDITEKVSDLLAEVEESMKANSWAKQEEKIVTLDSLDNVSDIVDEGKVVKFYWCGDEECGKAIEEETGVDILGINEEDIETDKVCPHCGKPAKHLALMAKTY